MIKWKQGLWNGRIVSQCWRYEIAPNWLDRGRPTHYRIYFYYANGTRKELPFWAATLHSAKAAAQHHSETLEP